MEREKYEFQYGYAFEDMPEARLRGTYIVHLTPDGKPVQNGRPNRPPSIERSIRAFKRRVKESGKLDELKARQEFVKRSVVRRRQLSAARNRSRKLLEIARESDQ